MAFVNGLLQNTKNPRLAWVLSDFSAGWTGLEPATSAVTGQHSNQLNYQPVGPKKRYKKSYLLFSDCKDRKIYFFKTKLY